MYTVEFESESTVITILCEKDDQEDVEIIIDEDNTVFIRQFQEYKNEIENNWPKAETSTKHKWVEYNKEYTTKKSVDFENENITVSFWSIIKINKRFIRCFIL